MEQIITFLSQLNDNNNREWFAAHRDQYRQVQQLTNHIAAELIAQVSLFDGDIAPLAPADCTYRIYRDTRFSSDKTPYKNHIGIYLCRGGKNSGYAGYYLHLEADNKCIIAAGLYCPEAKVLKSVREEIDTNGARFIEALNAAEGFALDGSDRLKRLPKGYSQENPYAEYLKYKHFTPMKHIEQGELFDSDSIARVAKEFEKCKPLNDILNSAVNFAREM